jgi:hypothetical protein
VLYDPERRWIDKGSCRTVDPERFFTAGNIQPSRGPATLPTIPTRRSAWSGPSTKSATKAATTACYRSSFRHGLTDPPHKMPAHG